MNYKELESFDDVTYRVSDISKRIKVLMESNFSNLKIRGEISGLKIASSGHAYFNLKDENSVLSCTCWKKSLSSFKVKIEEGMDVLATGDITTYQGHSRYQLNVRKIHHTGTGALMEILEKRRKALMQEGLFEAKNKKSLPFFPSKIGIITSSSGSVIKDMIHRIEDRCPTQLMVINVAVQGQKSSYEVSSAIKYFNSLGFSDKPEVIIVARGGGSIEDLWSFNEENVVRAAFSSSIPIISAIGHETDFTLLDLVADIRAPTPTAAAEMCTPVLKDIKKTLLSCENIIFEKVISKLTVSKKVIDSFDRFIINSQNILHMYEQKVDMTTMSFESFFFKLISEKSYRCKEYKLSHMSPLPKVRLLESSIESIRLHWHYYEYLDKCCRKLNELCCMLDGLSITKTLKRGFSIIRSPQGVIKSIKSLEGVSKINVMMHDGNKDLNLINNK